MTTYDVVFYDAVQVTWIPGAGAAPVVQNVVAAAANAPGSGSRSRRRNTALPRCSASWPHGWRVPEDNYRAVWAQFAQDPKMVTASVLAPTVLHLPSQNLGSLRIRFD